MILKFTHNLRINKDSNISVASEQIVDSESEAEAAGEEFAKYLWAFLRGYVNENEELGIEDI